MQPTGRASPLTDALQQLHAAQAHLDHLDWRLMNSCLTHTYRKIRRCMCRSKAKTSRWFADHADLMSSTCTSADPLTLMYHSDRFACQSTRTCALGKIPCLQQVCRSLWVVELLPGRQIHLGA